MQQKQLTIEDAETARIFEDRSRVRLLEPFILQPRTLSEGAAKLGIKAPRLHYHARVFLDHGLLEAVGTTKINGRSVKLYQTTAKSFFLPFALTSSATLENLIATLAAPARANFISANVRVLEQLSPGWGLHWAHNGKNDIHYAMLPATLSLEEINQQVISPEGPALISFQDTLTLEHEKAKALQLDLVELSQRYHALQTKEGQRYHFQIGLVPVSKS